MCQGSIGEYTENFFIKKSRILECLLSIWILLLLYRENDAGDDLIQVLLEGNCVELGCTRFITVNGLIVFYLATYRVASCRVQGDLYYTCTHLGGLVDT